MRFRSHPEQKRSKENVWSPWDIAQRERSKGRLSQAAWDDRTKCSAASLHISISLPRRASLIPEGDVLVVTSQDKLRLIFMMLRGPSMASQVDIFDQCSWGAQPPTPTYRRMRDQCDAACSTSLGISMPLVLY